MAKNYFSRYVWLIDLINRHGYITMPEINRAWRNSSLNDTGEDMPERTFFNHKDAILDTFGLEIKCDRTMGYYIKDSGAISDTGMRTWLLQSLSLNNILNESSDMRDRILFEQIPSSQKFLTDIISAMRDGKAISITYQGFSRPESSTFTAYPYCVKIFRQRWYMLAKTPKWDFPTLYALDRMIDMEEMEETFELPKDFDAEKFFSNYFGIIIENAAPEDIRLKVDADQVKYYRSLPLHHSQQEVETTEQYSVFSLRVVPTFDLLQEILAKGNTVEVLSPAPLRNWVAEKAGKMNEIYKSQNYDTHKESH